MSFVVINNLVWMLSLYVKIMWQYTDANSHFAFAGKIDCVGTVCMCVCVCIKHNYRQHCVQRKAPVFNLLRGRFWGFLPHRGEGRGTFGPVPSCTPNFTPIGATTGIGPPNLKFLPRFDQNVEYKRPWAYPCGAYPLHDFHKICRVCTPFQDALAVKILLDSLKELWSYGVSSWRGLVIPKFSAPTSGKTMRQTPKVLEVQECAQDPLSPCQVLGLGFHPPPGRPKTLSFSLFVCYWQHSTAQRAGI